MSYPDYPNNRLIVNGVDLTIEFGLVLGDGYTLEPPSPKTYIVDIPGGNGKLDLTESLLGDTAYDNRKQEFTFYAINTPNFERLKTRVTNFLHGKYYSYKMTMDPGYTYKGRFTVSSYSHNSFSNGILGVFVVSVDAEPYKYFEDRVYSIDAVGGKILMFESGRKRVSPTISSNSYVKVIQDGKFVRLPKGTWKLNDISFTNGLNELYLNSFDIRNLTWEDLTDNNVTWGSFKRKPLYEWYKSNGDGTYVVNKWSDLENSTWSSYSNQTWGSLLYGYTTQVLVDNIYVKYEVGDL